MNYCLKCGRRLKVDQAFCPECGMKQGIQLPEETSTEDTGALLERRYLKKKRRRLWIMTSTIILVLGGAVGWYGWESKQGAPAKVIAEFKQAVKQSNTSKVIEMIEAGNPKLSPTRKDIDNFLNYASKNQKVFALRLEQLDKAIKNEKVTSTFDKQNNQWFGIKELEKKWGIFHQYALVVKPFYVEVNSNMEEARISFNGKEVGKIAGEEPVSIGPILPGIYDVESAYTGEYSSFINTQQLDFSKAKANKVKMGLSLEGAFVTIHTSTEAKIFINGEESGINPANAKSSGPFAMDGSITLHAELTTPDGIMKSESITLTNTKDIYLDINYVASSDIEKESPTTVESRDQESVVENWNDTINEQKLAEFIYNLSYYSVEAINNNDLSYVSGFFDEQGPGYAETKEYIEYVNNKGITEELLSNEMESFNVIDEDTLEITTTEEYRIFYGDGTEKHKTFVSQYLITYDVDDFRVVKLISTDEVE